ncbi:hypothetical protein [Streptomyces sp. NPDC059278]|uniref:hypothetical protein n=1 Tax=Streptomyces sp. NPDC059278 TaxID=3346801 RepID=UPI0036B0C11F
MTTQTPAPRPLSAIAADIRADWKNIYFGAVPYVEAMSELNAITDTFATESAEDIVRRFLVNASRWRGDKAREIKAELKTMVGIK